jgi:hypothetical protein
MAGINFFGRWQTFVPGSVNSLDRLMRMLLSRAHSAETTRRGKRVLYQPPNANPKSFRTLLSATVNS